MFSRSSLKVHNGWWKEQTDITNTWTQWTKNCNHCLMWLFKERICSLLILYKLGMIRGIQCKITDMHQRSSTWSVLQTLWNKKDSFLYSDLSAVQWQHKWTWKGQMKTTSDSRKWELYLTSSVIHMLNTTAQVTLNTWWNYCALQGQSFSNDMYRINTNG